MALGPSQTTKYSPVDSDEEQVRPPRERFTRRISIIQIAIWLEFTNIIVFGLLFALWHHSDYIWGYDGMPLQYNISRTFAVDKEDLSLVKNTAVANKYWKNVTAGSNNGLVSMPLSWAEDLGLSASNQNTAPGDTVLQVDMFHQLHCLDRIRQDIIGAKYLYQLNPNRTEDDPYSKHTLHCVDYLRQAIMCTGDMTLVSTGDDLEFDHSPPRMCRDFEAVRDWVWRNAWDWDKYLNGID